MCGRGRPPGAAQLQDTAHFIHGLTAALALPAALGPFLTAEMKKEAAEGIGIDGLISALEHAKQVVELHVQIVNPPAADEAQMQAQKQKLISVVSGGIRPLLVALPEETRSIVEERWKMRVTGGTLHRECQQEAVVATEPEIEQVGNLLGEEVFPDGSILVDEASPEGCHTARRLYFTKLKVQDTLSDLGSRALLLAGNLHRV